MLLLLLLLLRALPRGPATQHADMQQPLPQHLAQLALRSEDADKTYGGIRRCSHTTCSSNDAEQTRNGSRPCKHEANTGNTTTPG